MNIRFEFNMGGEFTCGVDEKSEQAGDEDPGKGAKNSRCGSGKMRK